MGDALAAVVGLAEGPVLVAEGPVLDAEGPVAGVLVVVGLVLVVAEPVAGLVGLAAVVEAEIKNVKNSKWFDILNIEAIKGFVNFSKVVYGNQVRDIIILLTQCRHMILNKL